MLFLQALDGAPVRKVVTRDGVQPAKLPYLHRGVAVTPLCLDQLAAVLDAAGRRGLYLVRGEPAPGQPLEGMRRTHRGRSPTIQEADQQWVLIDFDSLRPDVRGDEFVSDVARYSALAREALPPEYHGVACWYQATASAGIKPGIRLRLAFWLDRPVSNEYLRKRFIGNGTRQRPEYPVDVSLYTPSQPCILAPPEFDPSAPSRPLADDLRSGTLEGRAEVVCPVLSTRASATSAADLSRAARDVARSPEGARRDLLNKAAYRLAYRYPPEALPSPAIAASLLPAAVQAGLSEEEASQTLQAALRDGREKAQEDGQGWRADLVRDKDGRPTPTEANVYRIVQNAVPGLAFEPRSGSVWWTEPPPWGGEAPQRLKDGDALELCAWFQTVWGVSPGRQVVRAALEAVAALKTYDRLHAWIEALPPWDGTPRLDTFFIRHLGVDDTPFARAVTAAWFVQAARRVYATEEEPVRADHVLTLIGPQGLGKSTILRSLVPVGYCAESLPDMRDKDAALATSQAWIVELSELTQRKADKDVFKAFLTRTGDLVRLPYARSPIFLPRRCVFAATTNEIEFWTDPSGNRRFWPLQCRHQASPELVLAEREAIWAEAFVRAEHGDLSHLPPEIEQVQRKEVAEYEEPDFVLERLRAIPRKEMTYVQVLDAAGLRPGTRIKAQMRSLGWETRRTDKGFHYVPIGGTA